MHCGLTRGLTINPAQAGLVESFYNPVFMVNSLIIAEQYVKGCTRTI
jgi:hypothetical protein